jgi:ectoine hydroxylase-related dioxygenase (phytanoyl-CoA dioxygenase family)
MIRDRHLHAYREQGWFVLEDALDQDTVELLRRECQRFMDERDAQMDAAGTDVMDLDRRGKRYFVNDCSTRSPALRWFLLDQTMRDVCRATLGDDAYLFNDQFVVKGTDGETSFSWHQDGGYIPYEHPQYLTCWIALDDVDERNGTVYVLPYGRAGTREVMPHRRDPETNDMVGYFGDDPGVPALVEAGSIVCFSSTVFHRSGANTTDRLRRVYVAQYSPEPILDADGVSPRHQATPVLGGGYRPADGAP